MKPWIVLLTVLAVGCGGDTSDPGNGGGGSTAPGGAGGTAGSNPGDAAAESSGGATAGPSKVGDPCSAPSECPVGGSGSPECLTDWPGGYCAVASCEAHGHDCPDDPGLGGTATTGGKCVLDPEPTCLALCASSSDCRDGYACEPRSDSAGHGSVNVCVPSSSNGSGGMPSSGGGGGMGGSGMMDGGM